MMFFESRFCLFPCSIQVLLRLEGKFLAGLLGKTGTEETEIKMYV